MEYSYCRKGERIGIQSQEDMRYICHEDRRTFCESKGPIFYGLRYPAWLVVLVVTLVACGCPMAAIEVALFIDGRTVRLWLYSGSQLDELQNIR